MNKLCVGFFVILCGVLVVCLLHKLCGDQDVEVKTFLAFCLGNLQNAPLDIAGFFFYQNLTTGLSWLHSWGHML